VQGGIGTVCVNKDVCIERNHGRKGCSRCSLMARLI
jgi:hypothetical protein